MLNNNQFGSTSHGTEDVDQEDEQMIREIHALTPPRPPPPPPPPRHSHRSSSISMASTEGGASSENFTSMSREFSALVLAGSSIDHNNMSPMINYGHHYENEGNHGVNNNNNGNNNNNNLGRIGEEELMEETNPLAIVTDNHPFEQVQSSSSSSMRPSGGGSGQSGEEVLSVQRVKKEEVDAKIAAWQNAKIAKINNRFKREDAVINGWEGEQVQKATSWMKKIERKLEEKRARALEKMQNKVAKARRKAEEKRASAEAKRGTKVARVLEIANLMRAVGRPPAKKSFFKAV
ncbi:hypothetical protein RIF29_39444 [Crotalaria pallida]|uniref:Remorin C-terminal domain-containing protein n=1 Tax=Crotalaria pallida TaxID=3830 RepID=A0AAN9HPM0_CROPI